MILLALDPTVIYIDVIAFNTYPFRDETFLQSSNRNDIINYIKANDQYEDILDDIVDYIPTSRLGNLKIAITESNVSVNQNRADKGATGIGPGSFIGGQYWADFMGESLEHGVEFVSFWSVVEGTSFGGSNFLTDIGYISSETVEKRSSYWHYKLLADYFKSSDETGATFTNKFYSATISPAPNYLKAFGVNLNGAKQSAVLLMNQSTTTSHDYSIDLEGGPIAVSGTNPIQLSFPMGSLVSSISYVSNAGPSTNNKQPLRD